MKRVKPQSRELKEVLKLKMTCEKCGKRGISFWRGKIYPDQISKVDIT